MEKRFTALRIIGTIYKVLGIIAGVITIILVLGLCVSTIFGGAVVDYIGPDYRDFMRPFGMMGGPLWGILSSFGAILYGGGLAITLYAFGEGVYLLISLEENTRMTVHLLQSQAQKNSGEA